MCLRLQGNLGWSKMKPLAILTNFYVRIPQYLMQTFCDRPWIINPLSTQKQDPSQYKALFVSLLRSPTVCRAGLVGGYEADQLYDTLKGKNVIKTRRVQHIKLEKGNRSN